MIVAMTIGVVVWAIACCFHLISRNSKVYSGFGLWTLSSAILGTSGIMISLRGTIPDLFSYVVSNSLAIIAMIAIKSGIYAFFEQPRSQKTDTAIMLLFVPLQTLFTYVHPDLNCRSIMVSLAHFLVLLPALRFVISIRDRRINPANGFLVSVLFFAVFFSFLRTVVHGWSCVFSHGSNDNGIFAVSLLFQAAMSVFLYFSLLVTNAIRVETDLRNANEQIRTLQGILPICCHCKRIKESTNAWLPIDTYIQEHSQTEFSHGICPDCMKQFYPEIQLPLS